MIDGGRPGATASGPTAGAVYKVLILFGPPVDKGAFARYFDETHRAILDGLPHSEAVEVNWVAGSVTGDLPVHLLVELLFPTEEALQDGLNSVAGQNMARDYPSFASGGVTILLSNSVRIPSAGKEE
jgi:uncharacterized protein (TIGR02118 family)